MMGVDQAGHDQAATGIDGAVGIVITTIEVSHLYDFVAFYKDFAVFDEAILLIQRDQVSVGDQ